MADLLTEGVKDLYHDDQTLTRVRDVLLHQGWGESEAENIIGALLNNGVLFREFSPKNEMTDAMRDGYNYAAAAEYGTRRFDEHANRVISAVIDRVRQILMDPPGGMELEIADAAIRELIKEGLLDFDVSRPATINELRRELGLQAMKMPKDSDHPVTLEELIFTTLGTVSMCWIPGPGDAVFDSEMASRIGHELLRSLRARGAR